jgi:FlaA1/EpsC-like NDP-sugar epimerase
MNVPSRLRSLLVYSFDLCAVAMAWLGALALRFNFEWPAPYQAFAFWGLLCLLPLNAVLFRMAGLYRGIWAFASLPDLIRIGKAVALSLLGLSVGVLLLTPAPALPRSILLLYPLLLLALMAGGRLGFRIYKEHHEFGGLRELGRPVLVLGAGRDAANLVRELARSAEWHVVGILDDDLSKHSRELFGIRVLGPVMEIGRWAANLKVRHAIIAMPLAGAQTHKAVANACIRAGVRVFTLPTLGQWIVGHDAVSQIRRVSLEDLLGREAIAINTPEVREMLAGQVVMVTGAGGSIGSELCRQIARFRPALILGFELNEYALYCLCEELSDLFPEVGFLPLAGDVKDRARVEEVLQRHVPAVIFHAAAYKHVPLMEEHNAWQAVRNNVLGTWVLARAAQHACVRRFVLVSTDKAVNPTNVMGASKRLAERVCLALQQQDGQTRFEMVRFGNVLGSTGSVIPKFQAQIERGGPVTVTHPEITRYFMAISEAAQLVLQAAAMGEGGEVFVLDMGEPVRVLDLARDMIRLSGHTEAEIPIVFSGLRPGEKLYEEVLADSEETRPTHHPKLRVARCPDPTPFSLSELTDWLRRPAGLTDDEVRLQLRFWVPEYQPYVPPRLHKVSGGTV